MMPSREVKVINRLTGAGFSVTMPTNSIEMVEIV